MWDRDAEGSKVDGRDEIRAVLEGMIDGLARVNECARTMSRTWVPDRRSGLGGGAAGRQFGAFGVEVALSNQSLTCSARRTLSQMPGSAPEGFDGGPQWWSSRLTRDKQSKHIGRSGQPVTVQGSVHAACEIGIEPNTLVALAELAWFDLWLDPSLAAPSVHAGRSSVAPI
jgi:hypothetical protein